MRQDALNSQCCGTSVRWPAGKEDATEHVTDVSTTTTNPERTGRESHRNSQKTVQKTKQGKLCQKRKPYQFLRRLIVCVWDARVCVRQKEKGAELKLQQKLTRKYCECFYVKICENARSHPVCFRHSHLHSSGAPECRGWGPPMQEWWARGFRALQCTAPHPHTPTVS